MVKDISDDSYVESLFGYTEDEIKDASGPDVSYDRQKEKCRKSL